MSLVVRHCKAVSLTRVVDDGYILVKNGVIVEVGKEPFEGSADVVIDAEGLVAVPGFIDTHTHGIRGLDFTLNRDSESILRMAKYYAEHGVTGFPRGSHL
jgi:N-acetylglucosamine-6-phosphate deacetylase